MIPWEGFVFVWIEIDKIGKWLLGDGKVRHPTQTEQSAMYRVRSIGCVTILYRSFTWSTTTIALYRYAEWLLEADKMQQ